MKFRAFALGAGIAAAATGLIPAAAMAATTHLATTPPGTTPPVTSAGAGAGSGSSSSASANNKNNINIEVVTQLPRGVRWDNHELVDDHKRPLALPEGYTYADGGIVAPNDQYYFAPAGPHQGVVIVPTGCHDGRYTDKVKETNFVSDAVGAALKACQAVYNGAYNLIAHFFGTQDIYGGKCS